jgi:hypothetical protein
MQRREWLRTLFGAGMLPGAGVQGNSRPFPHTTGLRANGQQIGESERLVARILADYG